MKTILTTVLPAMALLALGGCATTSALSSTESDGVYYSSKDRTTYNAPARSTASAPVRDEAPESTASDAEVNPDYAASGSSSSSSSQSGSTEYYDDDYGYSARIRRFHQPAYRSFSYGYYDPFYADPFWYGGSPYAYSPYGYGGMYGGYDPFYSPFYGGSAVIVNIGFGRPYYNPWRYGYGGYGYGGGYNRGFYDGYRNGLYNGYGYGGGYGYGYYGNNGYYGGGSVRNNVPYKSRGSSGREALTTGRATTAGSGTGRSRSEREGGIANPVDGRTINGGTATTNPAYNGRSRVQPAGTASENGVAAPERVGRTREGSGQVLRRDAVFENESGGVVNSRGREAVDQPRTTESNGRRWRVVENGGSGTPQPADAPTYSEQRRSRAREVYNGEQRSGEQAVEQPIRRQRSSEQAVEQPVRRQRTESAPQRSEAPQRTYEAPQRSYEAPSRSSSPSMNSGGGGSNGGGGGRSGGGRGRD